MAQLHSPLQQDELFLPYLRLSVASLMRVVDLVSFASPHNPLSLHTSASVVECIPTLILTIFP